MNFDRFLAAQTAEHYAEEDRLSCCDECADDVLDDEACDCLCHLTEKELRDEVRD